VSTCSYAYFSTNGPEYVVELEVTRKETLLDFMEENYLVAFLYYHFSAKITTNTSGLMLLVLPKIPQMTVIVVVLNIRK